jgi:hypothetical protein
MTDRRQPPASEAAQPAAADGLRWSQDLTKSTRRGYSLLHSPLRITMGIGALIMIVGSFLPWAEGHLGFLHVQFGGFDRASDGLILAVMGVVVLLVFVRSTDFLDSPDGARRWAPLIVGLVCVGLWLVGLQQSLITIESWRRDYGDGAIVAGWWVTGIGALIVGVTGTFATLRHHDGQPSNRSVIVRKPRRSDAGPILTWLGAIGGMILGAALALEIFPAISVSAPMVFMGGTGMILGAYLGRSVGNAIGGQRRTRMIGR